MVRFVSLSVYMYHVHNYMYHVYMTMVWFNLCTSSFIRVSSVIEELLLFDCLYFKDFFFNP